MRKLYKVRKKIQKKNPHLRDKPQLYNPTAANSLSLIQPKMD